MPTIVSVNIDDLDAQFVEELKRDFAHVALACKLNL
jgi:hypothetical protein